MELREGGEAEEDVDDVGGQVRAALPVLPQQSHQGAHHSLCQHNDDDDDSNNRAFIST